MTYTTKGCLQLMEAVIKDIPYQRKKRYERIINILKKQVKEEGVRKSKKTCESS